MLPSALVLDRRGRHPSRHPDAAAVAGETRRELGAYLRFYNDQRTQQALGYRTSAEVFHQVTDVGEEEAVQAKESPIAQTLVSLAGAAGLSLNSTSIMTDERQVGLVIKYTVQLWWSP